VDCCLSGAVLVSATTADVERIENFLAYASRTPFVPYGKASANELTVQWSDDDGAYRSDIAYQAFEDARIDKRYTNQHSVPNGATVRVFGRYSKERGGIVPSITAPTDLIAGELEEIAATLRAHSIAQTTIACVLIAVVGGLIMRNR
jgi:hypothetical protein